MTKLCFFCKTEPANEQCSICKRLVCWQCMENHNCYPRESRAPRRIGEAEVLHCACGTCSVAKEQN